MLGAAGPGPAHHAKPSVKAVGPLVDHADLTALLYVQVMRSPISLCHELDLEVSRPFASIVDAGVVA
jgi:hypothetical protein